MFTVGGFSFSGSGGNKAIVFVNLKPVAERKGAAHSVLAVVNRLRPRLMALTGGLVIPFAPPTLQGVGSFGGFPFELQDRGGNSVETLAKVTKDAVRAASKRKELTGMFASFTADDPQILVQIDRAEGQEPRHPVRPDLRRAAGAHGLGVRQRLRLQQPRLPRLRAGRPAVPLAARRHRRVLRALERRADDPARHGGAAEDGRRRRRPSATTTCSARPRSTARRRPAVRRGRRWRRWRRRPGRCCRRA